MLEDSVSNLTNAYLVRVFGPLYFARGEDYFHTQRVVSATPLIREGSVGITGSVRGSGRHIYSQNITLLPAQGAADTTAIFGVCSCPVRSNCKHVVAVVLTYRESLRLQQETSVPVEGLSADRHLADWQEQFASCLAPQDFPNPEPETQCLIYLIKRTPHRYRSNYRLDVHSVRRLKRGGFGASTYFSLTNLNQRYSVPRWITAVDQQIAWLAGGASGTGHMAALVGDLGTVLLQRLIASGRCFLESQQQPPLYLDEPRSLPLEWLYDADQVVLTLSPEGSSGDWFCLPTRPPYYVIPATGACGPLLTEHSAVAVDLLRVMPPCAIDQLPALGLFFQQQYPGAPLPLPPEANVEVIAETPQPCLTLLGLPHSGFNGCDHVVRLEFDYGAQRCAPEMGSAQYCSLRARHSAADARDYRTSHQQGQTLVVVQRQLAEEEQAVAQLLKLGFAWVQEPGSDPHAQADFYFGAHSRAGSAACWHEFLEQDLPSLRDAGWLISIDPSFQMQFSEARQWQGELQPGEAGWFDLSLSIDIDGQSVELLPLIEQFFDQAFVAQQRTSQPRLPRRGLPASLRAEGWDAEDGSIPPHHLVEIGAGHWLKLPIAELLPVINTLLELGSDKVFADAQSIRLRHSDLAKLALLSEGAQAEGSAAGLAAIGSEPVSPWRGDSALLELLAQLRSFDGIASVAAPDALQAELRDYQQQGVNWLQFLGKYGFGGILADDMGLGKTVQTLAHLLVEKQSGRLHSPVLIVAPTSVIGNWVREVRRFTPDLSVTLLHGKDRYLQAPATDLWVTTYALLSRDLVRLEQQAFSWVILDEAQAIKNPSSKTAQAACRLNADSRLCLTGTPMENHLGELWSLMGFIMPDYLGSRRDFTARFRRPIEQGDRDQQRRLVQQIRPFMLRRTKEAVLQELPQKTEVIRSMPLAGDQARLYESIRIAMHKRVKQLLEKKGLASSQIEMLDALLKLRQVCCDPALVKLESAKGVVQSAKMQMLKEMLPELIEEGRRILIFSQFTSMLQIIGTALDNLSIPYTKLTGRTRKRDEVISRFQNAEVPVFLISLKAGGVGLNLTQADTVIHYDPWWNPAAEQQATDRAHRMGQDKPVLVVKLVTEGTVEEKIIALQARKQHLAQGLYGAVDQDTKPLAAEELLALFQH